MPRPLACGQRLLCPLLPAHEAADVEGLFRQLLRRGRQVSAPECKLNLITRACRVPLFYRCT
eukprot:7617820-Alexandrium_andersonii.AAC.1